MMTIREYKRAESLEEAWQLNQKKPNRILGGMIWLKMETINVGTAIDLSGLGLDTIEETEDSFSIGAMVTLRQLEQHPELVAKLQENALYLRRRLEENEIKIRPSNGDIVPIIPIYTYEPIETLTIAKELYDAGVYVNSSLPPAAAPHECLLRTSLMATHTHALIDEAVGIMKDVLRRHDL